MEAVIFNQEDKEGQLEKSSVPSPHVCLGPQRQLPQASLHLVQGQGVVQVGRLPHPQVFPAQAAGSPRGSNSDSSESEPLKELWQTLLPLPDFVWCRP